MPYVAKVLNGGREWGSGSKLCRRIEEPHLNMSLGNLPRNKKGYNDNRLLENNVPTGWVAAAHFLDGAS